MIQFVQKQFSFAFMNTWEVVSQKKKILTHTGSDAFYSFSCGTVALFGVPVNKNMKQQLLSPVEIKDRYRENIQGADAIRCSEDFTINPLSLANYWQLVSTF